MSVFDACPTCGGYGYRVSMGYVCQQSANVHPCDECRCPTCNGRGRVVSESVIEEMAQALYAADDGWAELWDNIGDGLRHAYREMARAASRVVLEHMEDTE